VINQNRYPFLSPGKTKAKPPAKDLQSIPVTKPLQQNHTNIDKNDRDDPLAVSEYVQDIYDHLRIKESELSPSPYSLTRHPELNETMVSILIDWLVLVQHTHHGHSTLTANIIHRFLCKSGEEITRSELQLVGVAAYLIASKYEDIYAPCLSHLVYVSDDCCSQDDIVSMEVRILKALEYRVSAPTAYTFLGRYLTAAEADETMTLIANYILDGTLLNERLLGFRPSELASASILIARSKMVGCPLWNSTLENYSGYSMSRVLMVAKSVLKEKADIHPTVQAVNKKYSKIVNGQVSYTFDPTSLTAQAGMQ
jgi:G2/mitotic-specific cyclin-B, other